MKREVNGLEEGPTIWVLAGVERILPSWGSETYFHISCDWQRSPLPCELYS